MAAFVEQEFEAARGRAGMPVERDIALALCGWFRPGGSGGAASVADAYGSGYRPMSLFEAISKVRYPDLDLSHLHEWSPALVRQNG